MKNYKVLVSVYATFLTPQDSYMQEIMVGEVLQVKDGCIYYKGKESIDYPSMWEEAGYIKEIKII